MGVVIHGCYGAFMASLLALLFTWQFEDHLSWAFVAICAVVGFVFSGPLGVRFMESLGGLLKLVF